MESSRGPIFDWQAMFTQVHNFHYNSPESQAAISVPFNKPVNQTYTYNIRKGIDLQGTLDNTVGQIKYTLAPYMLITYADGTTATTNDISTKNSLVEAGYKQNYNSYLIQNNAV